MARASHFHCDSDTGAPPLPTPTVPCRSYRAAARLPTSSSHAALHGTAGTRGIHREHHEGPERLDREREERAQDPREPSRISRRGARQGRQERGLGRSEQLVPLLDNDPDAATLFGPTQRCSEHQIAPHHRDTRCHRQTKETGGHEMGT